MGWNILVISGGGAKIAFEVGVISQLILERGLDFDGFVGVSSGALAASVLAQGKGRDGLVEQTLKLREVVFGIQSNDDIYYKRFGGVVGIVFGADSIYSNEPLKEKIYQHVIPARLKDSGKALKVGVVSLRSGKYYAADQRANRILALILASTAIPFVFPPVEFIYSGDKYQEVDGGARNITPLDDAFDLLQELDANPPREKPSGPDTIYVVLSSPLEVQSTTKTFNNAVEIAKRAVEIMTAEIFANDLKIAQRTNDLVLAHDEIEKLTGKDCRPEWLKRKRWAKIPVIKPETEIVDPLEFDPEKMKRADEHGWTVARQTNLD